MISIHQGLSGWCGASRKLKFDNLIGKNRLQTLNFFYNFQRHFLRGYRQPWNSCSSSSSSSKTNPTTIKMYILIITNFKFELVIVLKWKQWSKLLFNFTSEMLIHIIIVISFISFVVRRWLWRWLWRQRRKQTKDKKSVNGEGVKGGWRWRKRRRCLEWDEWEAFQ